MLNSHIMLALPRSPVVAKQPQTHLNDICIRQRCTLEIIELVEVPPPSRGELLSVPCSSSAASSSHTDDDNDDDDDESVESYCSSESELEQPSRTVPREPEVMSAEQAWHARMRRIEAWRDAYAKALGAEFAPSPSRTKRKGSADEDDDTFSRSSKRSRQTSALSSEHSCSACNASFATRQSLRRHGRGVRTNEACRAAVEYGFE